MNFWATIDSEMNNIFTQPTQAELLPELLDFNNNLTLSNASIDQLFLQQNFHLFNSFDSYNPSPHDSPFHHLAPQTFDLTDSKRRKSFDYEDFNCSDLLYPGFVPNPCVIQDLLPPPDHMTTVKAQPSGSCRGNLSAQSMAARQRRRKITEKTQELGKLIPGGQKMNTAEMLQAGCKYIKFLQTQVGILEFIGSYAQGKGETIYGSDELGFLLESTLIQEKLYSTEKCLVPIKFVESLVNNGEMGFNSQVLKECKKLMLTMEH